ncbi:MAG TPA: hypothetical protein VGE52_08885 [Pirellulales bacterium]
MRSTHSSSPLPLRSARRAIVAAMVFVSAITAVSAARGDWPFRFGAEPAPPTVTLTAAKAGWNPFAKKPSSGPKEKSIFRKAGDSTMSAIKGTGNAIKKGASYLNPWRKKPNNAPVTGVTERRSRNKEKEQSSGWFSWMRPKPQPQPPQTVNEWLRQDRPDVR